MLCSTCEMMYYATQGHTQICYLFGITRFVYGALVFAVAHHNGTQTGRACFFNICPPFYEKRQRTLMEPIFSFVQFSFITFYLQLGNISYAVRVHRSTTSCSEL